MKMKNININLKYKNKSINISNDTRIFSIKPGFFMQIELIYKEKTIFIVLTNNEDNEMMHDGMKKALKLTRIIVLLYFYYNKGFDYIYEIIYKISKGGFIYKYFI